MGTALRCFEETTLGKLVMRVSAVEGHRLWAPIYNSGPNPILALERRAMGKALKSLRPSTVIDVACGTGQWLSHFQRSGSEVFGCDACEEMLREAMKMSSLHGRLTLAEAESIPFRACTADLILCSVSLSYFRDIHRVFHEFARASEPGGFIAVSDLHPDALAAGWTRSFKVGQQQYHLEHHARPIQEVAGAASSAGLTCKLCREVYFGAPELPIFQRSGKGELFTRIASIPALFIALWEKPC